MNRWHELTFSKEEYARRQNAVRAEMQKKGIDLLMLSTPDNITYLSGFQTSGYDSFNVMFLPLDGEPYMVTRRLEESNVFARTPLSQTCPYADTENPFSKVKEAFDKFSPSAKSIGIERQSFYLTTSRQKCMEDLFHDKKIVDASGTVEPVRAVKSDTEIEILKKAAVATEAGMQAGILEAQIGNSENDVAGAMHNAMYRAGGEYPSVPPYITSGPRTIIGHATWEGRTIEKDEIVFLELAGCYRRYHTAMMRTVFTGANPPSEVSEAAKLVMDDLRVLMEKMQPGITAGEVDRITRDHSRFDKIGATRISRTGYSMGIAYAPSWDEGQILSLVDGNEVPLQENMVFHLIPWLQLPKYQWVMSISETVRVTSSGAKSFFTLPQDLILKA